MKSIFKFSILLLCFLTVKTQAEILTIKEGNINFFSKAPLEDIKADNNSVTGLLNTSAKSVAMLVPVRKFKFDKDLMQEHFNEKYMESDKYPSASFNGNIAGDIDFTKDNTYNVTVTGKLNMHGVEKEVSVPGTIVVKGGLYTVNAVFNVKCADYKIEIPKLLFENIAEEIKVTVSAVFQPYVKK